MSPLPMPPHANSVLTTGHPHRHREKRRARTCWRLTHLDARGWPAGQCSSGTSFCAPRACRPDRIPGALQHGAAAQGIAQRVPADERDAHSASLTDVDPREIRRKPVPNGLINEYVSAASAQKTCTSAAEFYSRAGQGWCRSGRCAPVWSGGGGCRVQPHGPRRPTRKPSTPATGPRWPTRTGADSGNSVCHASVPQLDPAGHNWTQASAQIWSDVLDLRKCRLKTLAHRLRPLAGRFPAPALHTPLTSQDLAHHWPTATGNGLPNRSRTRIRPGLREHRHRV